MNPTNVTEESLDLFICKWYYKITETTNISFYRIRKLREEAKESGTFLIYLYAGDTFTGTEWYTKFKGEICSRFMNLLAPDAMVINLDDESHFESIVIHFRHLEITSLMIMGWMVL